MQIDIIWDQLKTHNKKDFLNGARQGSRAIYIHRQEDIKVFDICTAFIGKNKSIGDIRVSNQ